MRPDTSGVETVHYIDTDGQDLIAYWLNGLRDRRARARIERLELGLIRGL